MHMDELVDAVPAELPKTQIAFEKDGVSRVIWGAPGITAARLAAEVPAGTAWREVSADEAEAILAPTPEEIAAQLASAIRAERDRLVAATDYLLLPDYPVDAALLEAITAYRQALRDVPAQAGFPREVIWPEHPLPGQR